MAVRLNHTARHNQTRVKELLLINYVGYMNLCVAGNGSSSGSQPSPSGGYLPHGGGHGTPTPSSTPVSDMSPHGVSGSPPLVAWDMKPNIAAPTHHHPHHHPGYMPQYSWYQADANQGLLT